MLATTRMEGRLASARRARSSPAKNAERPLHSPDLLRSGSQDTVRLEPVDGTLVAV